ncbi:MAG TPA: ADOP family duplicated permease, partial [Thermoanaerobaculia bacterium]|nr:ADOP family duplicated permease [Thermoanaerobaculia bacterium]
AGQRSFDALVGWSSGSANLTGVAEPVALRGQWTTRGFFSVLGVTAALGRTPLPEEEGPGAPRVVLLGDGLWRSRFGADSSVLGRTLILNGDPFTVIGVLPRDFVFVASSVDLAGPLVVETDRRRLNRSAGFLRLIGRLKPGVSRSQASADLDSIVGRLRAAYPDSNANKQGVQIQPLADLVTGGFRQRLLLLQIAVGLVLLIACTNLANLLLARASARQSEFALRSALGARRRDLIGQTLTESGILALGGGVVGLGFAAAGVRALLALAPVPIPRAAEIHLDAAALAFNLALSLATGLAVGLVPAILGTRGADGLRGTGRGQTEGRRGVRTRSLLIAAEVSLSLLLLTGAALLIRTMHRLEATDPGFEPDRLLAVQLSLPKSRYNRPEEISRYAEQVTDRLAALSGVERVGAASLNPLTQWRASISFTIEGKPELDARHAPLANYRAVGAGYFRALQLPLLAGREIDARDRADSPPVAVISQTLARRHFPGASPLGARLRIDDVEAWRTVEVVGVVGDVRFTGLDAPGGPDVYVPYAQTPPDVSVWLANIFCVAVRTRGDPQSLAAAVRREIHALDRDVAVASIRPMAEALGGSLAERRFHTILLEIFAAAALALALAGIHAVTAHGVVERTREIGVRLSLGSGRLRILKLVVGQALLPVGCGILLGAAAALGLGRLLSGLLYGVAPHDPITLLAVAVVVVLAASLASALPALRAARIDPVRALRAE